MSCCVFILPLLSKAIFAGYKRCHLVVFLHTLFLKRNLLTFVLLCIEYSPPHPAEEFKYFVALILINLSMMFLKVGFVVLIFAVRRVH